MLPVCFVASFALVDIDSIQPGERFQSMCRPSLRCSFLISALRDPRDLSAWRIDPWKRAIDQLLAYRQLFSEDDTASVERRRGKRAALISRNIPLLQHTLQATLD
ncbi:hypothetical protein Tcan_12113 [Toxocara canis]|uniref:Uncharacterized protein n=1 Tax=Toxocara canis TaxID=6265 RepID=A0A0B2UMU7_TOXCA|nr:hypothetical protein Tcan_12113 [Toxocara canis]